MAKTSKKTTKHHLGIYLDYASSSTPNAGSIHSLGIDAKNKLENARKEVAKVLDAHKNEIIFTSGGTESNNLAISGTVWSIFEKNTKKILPHIITTNIEHPSVLETCKMLEQRGFIELSIVPVESIGIVDPKKIKKEIKENTVLVSVMYANNEIGTIQPIKEIAKEIRHYRKLMGNEKNLAILPSLRGLRHGRDFSQFPIFHSDAVQAVNYLDLNVERLGVDMMTISGSKIEGSPKVGLLYKRRSVNLAPLYAGGNQEMGLRPGTENVEDISIFANALEYTQKIKEKESARLAKLRDYFIEKLKNVDSKIIINGDIENRLPNNINITISNIPSDLLVLELDARGVYVSSKSACKSGDGKASYVIEAIDKNIKQTDGSLRFSFGRDTKKSDIDYALKSLTDILQKLKKWYS